MERSLINPDQTLLLFCVIALITAFLFVLDRRFNHPIISGSVLLLIIPPVLSNLYIIPFQAPAYDVLWEYGLPLSLPLVLLSANLKTIFTETGPVLVGFLCAVVGAMVGAIVAYPILGGRLFSEEIAGTLTASYVGGSLNFAATAQALNFDDPSVLTATLAADNLMGAAFIVTVSSLAGLSFIQRRFRPEVSDGAPNGNVAKDIIAAAPIAPAPIAAADLAALFALSICIFGLGEFLESKIGLPAVSITTITLLSIATGQVFPNFAARTKIAYDIGMVILFFVFISVFAGANAGVAIANGPMILAFVAIMVTVQMLLVFILSAFFKLRLSEAAIGLMAAAMGPSIAAAFAASKGWRELVTPGILAGIFGYAIGNFAGFFVHFIVS